MKNLNTQAVIVIVAFLAAIVVLALADKDTAVLVAVGSAVLGGLGLIAGQQSGIRDNTNGNMTKVLAMIEKQSHMLAAMKPTEAIEASMADVGKPVSEQTDQPHTFTPGNP